MPAISTSKIALDFGASLAPNGDQSDVGDHFSRFEQELAGRAKRRGGEAVDLSLENRQQNQSRDVLVYNAARRSKLSLGGWRNGSALVFGVKLGHQRLWVQSPCRSISFVFALF